MKTTTTFLGLLLLAASLLALPMQAQTIRYVTTSGSNTTPGTATSWATSTTNLQGAIEASAVGDQVWVAQGTYKPGGATNTDRTISFSMKAGVAIYGSFVGTEQALSDRPVINPSSMPNAARPSSTTLSGDIGTLGDAGDNSYHVINNGASLNLTASARLDGFVITGGNCNVNGQGSGGGMSNSSCSPTLANCSFQGNASSGAGGGMSNERSSPVLTNCSFVSNSARQAAGMLNFQSSNPVLTNCLFRENSATLQGGGMYNFLDCNPMLINCSFQGNSSQQGGGIHNDDTGNPVLTNCSFQGNSATLQGGVMYNFLDCNPVLTNCVVFGNGGSNTFYNYLESSVTVRYSLLEASVSGYAGENNLTTTTSPFATTTDTRLAGNASAINAGSNQAYSNAGGPATDLAGYPRFFSTGGTGTPAAIDMGAYEYICPTRLYVKANATGTNTGLDWTNAFTDLQSALNYTCSVNLSEIWVAAGTYKPTAGGDRSISFVMKNGVAIYGGFVGTEQALSYRPASFPSPSILSGDIGTVGNNTDNSYHVLTQTNLTASARLDGFVIQGGNANGSFPHDRGAGSYIDHASPQFVNCVFQNNSGVYGGAMAIDGTTSSATPRLTNCLFMGNSASNQGGALYNYGSSGGNASPVLVNCSFQANTATNGGAGLYNNGAGGTSSPSLTNCSFQGNSTAGNGGAMFSEAGGGTSSPVLTNCVVYGNGGSNSFYSYLSNVSVRYSLVEASATEYSDGGNNVRTSVSPFASTTATQLAVCSPGVNAGSNGAYSTAGGPATDLAGNPRIFPSGGTGTPAAIDMGAYEQQTSPQMPARLYVKANATGANTGLDWTNAFTDLQSALNYACSGNLSEIWVAAGTYKPTSGTDRNLSFVMKAGVAIYGGFLGTEQVLSDRPALNPVSGPGGASQPSSSTLSGDIGTIGDAGDNSYHVINNGASLSLTASARLDGFVITGGNGNGNGNDQSSGGGMYNASSSPTLANCSFVGNSSRDGGGMYNTTSSNPVLTNCIFQTNSTSGFGGGMYNYVSCNPVLTNCSFQSNTASNNGGAMANGVNSSPQLINCVVFGNGAGNTFLTDGTEANAVRAHYSLLEASVSGYVGDNNRTTTTYPFASTTSTQLSACSPAINAGSNVAYTALTNPPATDLAGNPRIFPNGGVIDMGAYEFQATPQMPARLYVKANATGANTGLDWTNAFTDLQSALNYACSGNLTEIWVATGTYKPTSGTDRNLSFVMKAGVAIYGGFLGTEQVLSDRPALNPVSGPGGASQPSSSTLSGDIGTLGDAGDNSYHVINNGASLSLTASARLDGFVITGGNGNGDGNDLGSGGGMYNASSSPTLANCSFVGNSSRNGGGMFNSTSSNPVLTNCIFQTNSTSGGGGGMSNFTSSPSLINCSFVGNSTDEGGGMWNNSSSPTLANCSFVGNSAGNGGGMWNNSSSPTLANCSFVGNSAGNEGGGVWNRQSSPSLTNCSFVGNKADQGGGNLLGGGMYNYLNSSPVLTNCSFQANSANVGGGMFNLFNSDPSLTNCVVFGNGASNTFVNDATSGNGSSITARYSLLEASVSGYGGDNNRTTTTSPFASTTATQLSACSPAINAGSNAAYTALTNPSATDLAGNPRFFNGGVIDMGAYEYQGTPTSLPVNNPAITSATLNQPFSQSFTASGGSAPYSFSQASGSLPTGLSLSANGQLSGTPTQTGSFTITVRVIDAAGCAGSSAPYGLTVSDATPTIGTFAANPASVCVGNPVTFTASLGNVSGDYSFTLAGGNNLIIGSASGSVFSQSLTASGSGSQSYSLIISSSGQSTSTSTSLTVNALPTPTLSASPSTTLTCAQTSLTLTAGGGSSYAFSPNVVSQSGNMAVVNASGLYSVTVTNGTTGCFSVTSITVSREQNMPSVSITANPSLTITQGQSATLTAQGGVGYSWSTGASTPSIIVSTAGPYSVTSTSPNGCTGTASVTLTVTPVMSGPFAITGVTTVSCTPILPNRFSISFTPRYDGLNGAPLSFSVTNELLPTTQPGPYTLQLYTDNPVITLEARQSGASTRYTYNWLEACNSSTAPNTPPRVAMTIPSQTATVGQPMSYVIPAGTFTDEETPTSLRLSASGLPAGLSFSGGTLSGTPSTTVGSPFSITITATDPGNLSVSTLLMLTVLPTSSTPPPTSAFSITGVTTISCTPVANRISISFQPRYAGLTGQPIAFEVVNESIPTTDPGPYSLTLYRDNPVITLRATQTGSSGPVSFAYNWLNACTNLGQDNTPPRLNSPVGNQTAVVGQNYSLNLSNTFIDQETPDQITLSASGLPAGLTVSGKFISGTPSVSGVSSVTLTATDGGGLSTSTSFTLTVVPAPVIPPPTTTFSITGVTTMRCEVLSAGQRRVTFNPRYAGQDGSPVSFSVTNEMLPTTNPGPYVLNLYTDNPVITLQARQSGVSSSFSYGWLAACNPGARQGVVEAGTGLQVRVLGNPIEGKTLEVEILGVDGQAVELELVSLQGHRLHQQRIEPVSSRERVSLPVESMPGVFLVQVSTATQRQAVKVVKR